MKLYLDMNIYNRIFDDNSQIKISFESMAVDVITSGLCDLLLMRLYHTYKEW